MGFFDDIGSAISRIFTLPGGGSSTLTQTSGPTIAPPPPAPPPLPTILQTPPTVAPSVVMPTLTSGADAARAQAALLAARQGRASTILTSRKKRRPGVFDATFDSYGSDTVSGNDSGSGYSAGSYGWGNRRRSAGRSVSGGSGLGGGGSS